MDGENTDFVDYFVCQGCVSMLLSRFLRSEPSNYFVVEDGAEKNKSIEFNSPQSGDHRRGCFKFKLFLVRDVFKPENRTCPGWTIHTSAVLLVVGR